jgi:hypothetical protein
MSLLSQDEIDYEHENKLIKELKLREYNAFLVNNRDRLVDIFSKISQEKIADIQETETAFGSGVYRGRLLGEPQHALYGICR